MRDPFLFDRAAETMPRSELAALQLQRLQQTVEHVYANVSQVRRKLQAAKVAPENIKSLADVARLPFSQKVELRDNYPFGLFAVPI
jgi:phenylacetate-CoA ligase